MKLKEIADAVLIPLAIAGVGVLATLKATDIQKNGANEIAEIRARQSLVQYVAGKDVDLTEQFFDLLDKPNICNKPGRVKILLEMASFDQSKRINKQYLEECPPQGSPSQIQDREKNTGGAVDEAARNQTKKLVAALEGSARRTARTELAELYTKRPTIVAEELARAVSENYDNYRITLGVLVVLGSVSGGWIADGELEKQMKALQKSSYKNESTFSKWLKRASENRKT